MTKTELTEAVALAKAETKNALQTVYDALNQGQQKKIVKNESVKKLFDLYGVNYSESESE
jgi:Fe2+ or Zn2+ uptake regulation protein